MNQFVILSFGVDPLNWLSFIEIGEIACSTPAWSTHGLTLKADTHEGFCSRSMLQAHFARVSTHEGAFSSSLNLPRELAPKYLTG